MSSIEDTRTTRHTAICRHCPLEVAVQTQDALDDVIDVLEGGASCPYAESGHDLKQVFPQ